MVILIVDDSEIKIKKIKVVIDELHFEDIRILVAKNIADAMSCIRETLIDLLILDLNLPVRKGENPKKDAGIQLLKELNKRSQIKKPNHIIGLTAYNEIKKEVDSIFTENGWLLMTFDLAENNWEITIKNKILYLKEAKNSKKQTNTKKNNSYALVMKGGGIKGLAYVGALQVLSPFFKFDWYAGTSAGAITASLLAAGYDYNDLKKILEESNFSDFKDAKFPKTIFNLRKGGMHPAETFKFWLNTLVAKKLDLNGLEIKMKHLKHRCTIFASTRTKKALVFDSLNEATTDMSVAHAARCSMSIPYIFLPESWNGHRVYDGGLQYNYAVDLILENNPEQKFVGLFLAPTNFNTNKPKIALLEPIKIWTEAVSQDALENHYDNTVLIDPEPISVLQFRLNQEEKDFLLDCGRLGAMKFLRRKQISNIDSEELKKLEKRVQKKREILKNRKKAKRLIGLLKYLSAILLVIIGFQYYNNNWPFSNSNKESVQLNQTSFESGVLKPIAFSINGNPNIELLSFDLYSPESMYYTNKKDGALVHYEADISKKESDQFSPYPIFNVSLENSSTEDIKVNYFIYRIDSVDKLEGGTAEIVREDIKADFNHSIKPAIGYQSFDLNNPLIIKAKTASSFKIQIKNEKVNHYSFLKMKIYFIESFENGGPSTKEFKLSL